MVFLNPTILLGLLAASIPVILHFLNLRKIKKVEFSTLAFLKELQKSKIRRIKIKQWLLLLLRTLIIALLVLAFARPTLESSNISGVGSKAKTTAVIILDNTFSMSVINPKGSLIAQSKEFAKRITTLFETGDEVHLIIMSDNKDIQHPSAKSIDNIEVSYVTTKMNSALKTASEILMKTKNFNKELYILSDFQKSSINKTDSVWEKLNFENTHLYFVKFGGENIKNLSVTNLKINNQIFEVNKEITLISEITNYSTENMINQLTSLTFNGKRVAQKGVSVNSGSSQRVKYNATIEKSGVLEIVAELEDDAILYDNKFYNYIIVPDKIKILLSSSSNNLMFVKAALNSNKGGGFNITEILPNKLNSINLNDYDVIIISATTGMKISVALEKYVKEGGRILMFPPQDWKREQSKIIFKKLGIPEPDVLAKSNSGESINSFDKIDFSHPVFNSVFNKKNTGIDSPEFYKYLKYTPKGKGKVVISLQDNSSFFSEFNKGKGRVLFCNIAPDLTWSNFPLKNIFAPLVNRSVIYLASDFTQNEFFIAGGSLWVDVSKRKSNQIKVVLPNGSEDFVNVADNRQNHFTYTKTDLTGIYKFYSGKTLLDVKAVNYNSAESNLKSYSSKEIKNIFKKKERTVVEILPDDDLQKRVAVARYGSELWSLFLLMTLLLALIEMYIAKSSKKDLTEII